MSKLSGRKKAAAVALAIMIGGMPAVPYLDYSEVQAASDGSNVVATKYTYDEVFKIARDEITSVRNNAGHYGSSVIANMIDGNKNTHWETSRSNSQTFKNHVVVTFAEEVELGSVVFYPRVTGAANKGFPTQYTIYASTTDSGDNFEVVKEGTARVASGGLTIKLDTPTKFKRLKFEFNEAHDGWAAIAELDFYKPDPLTDKVNDLFTDGTMSAVKAQYNNETVMAGLVKEAETHPNSATLISKIEIAKEIMNGADYTSEIITVPQNGNPVHHARNVLKMSSFATNYIPTGIAAMSGSTIKVYVEAEDGQPLPKLMFAQQIGSWRGWQKEIALKQGENIITVPTVYDTAWSTKTKPGGGLYIINPYTESQQGQAPKVRIQGGHDYPLFTDGDNEQAFIAELQAYVEKVKSEPDKYVDIVELQSDYFIFNSNTLSGTKAFIEGKNSPQNTVDVYNDRLNKYLEYAGLYKEAPQLNDTQGGIRANMRLMQPWGLAYAGWDGHTGWQQNEMNSIFAGKAFGWAVPHELGHHYDIQGGYILEVTNNMWSNYNAVDLNGEGDRIAGYYPKIFTTIASDDYKNVAVAANGYIEQLAVWWQLHLLDKDYWAKYQAAFRDNIASNMGLTQNERMAVVSSYALGYDVIEHFERHKFIERNDKVNAALQQLNVQQAPENMKPWYMWTKATKDRESSFENVDYTPEIVSVKRNASNKVEIKMNIAEQAKPALLGYEVLEDGKVIGFTNTDTFTTLQATDGNEHTYQVRAFDLRSNATTYSQELSTDIGKPQFELVRTPIVAVNESFDLNSLVVAKDMAGNLLSNITVQGNVDTSKPGVYDVTYAVTDNSGKTATTTVQVNVYDEMKYASDIAWKSAVVGWGEVRKDKNVENGTIRLLVDGQATSFEKGIGAHAHSEIVYDIAAMEEKPQAFSAIVGIDYGKANNATNDGNVIFNIYADGNLVKRTSALTPNSNAQFINVDLTGVSELKLVANTNGPDYVDHAVWADAKFYYKKAIVENPTEMINTIKASVERLLEQDSNYLNVRELSYIPAFADDYAGNQVEMQIFLALQEEITRLNAKGQFTIYISTRDYKTLTDLMNQGVYISYVDMQGEVHEYTGEAVQEQTEEKPKEEVMIEQMATVKETIASLLVNNDNYLNVGDVLLMPNLHDAYTSTNTVDMEIFTALKEELVSLNELDNFVIHITNLNSNYASVEDFINQCVYIQYTDATGVQYVYENGTYAKK